MPANRLTYRLGAIVGVPLVVLIAMTIVVGVQLLRIADDNRALEQARLQRDDVHQWIAEARANTERAVLLTRLAAAVGDDDPMRERLAGVAGAMTQAMADSVANVARVQERLLADLGQADPVAADLLARFTEERRRFVQTRAQIQDDLLLGEGGTRIDAELTPLTTAMLATLDQLQKHLGERSAAASATVTASVRQAQVALLLACVLALVAGIVLTQRLARSVVRRVDQAAAFAQTIATGDLRPTMTVAGRDEVATLQGALLTMRDRLAAIVAALRDASNSIGTASSQIASGNQDLSGRTEQTAANLQQAASSIEQLTGTVAHSADSAAQANQLASSAADVARRGGSVVAQVVSTMNDISASSKKIADIIGVIDGIAFQTNILALNAAVEAARAGEQGRGFAVVAAEVRSLAQRSAEAAKEIKALIGSSVDKVEAGSRLVGDAGSTMTEIVASVQRVADIIGEISAATREQSSGIGQVNSAVADLDRMTQQNAALVEQSAAAAHSLEEQARRLTQVVATFKVDADASARATALTPAAVAAQAAVARAAQQAAAKPAATPAATAAGTPAATAAGAPAKRAATATTADGDWQTF